MDRATAVWIRLAGGGVAVYGLVELVLRPALLVEGAGSLVVLAAAAALAAVAAPGKASPFSTRFAPTFILVSAACLPSPAVLIVGFGATLAGCARADSRSRRRVAIGLASAAISLGMVQFLATLGPASFETLAGLAWIFFMLIALQGTAAGIALLLARRSWQTRRRFGSRVLRELLGQAVNAPLAWILAGLVERQAWLEAIMLSAVILAAQTLQSRTFSALRRSRRYEIDTIRAVGREIFSADEPSDLYVIVDRECRKLFDVEVCCIACYDPRTGALKRVYRRRNGAAAETEQSDRVDPLARRSAEDESSLRFDDLLAETRSEGEGREAGEPAMRSAVIAPLIVDRRVLGTLSVKCRTPRAYDDCQLALLGTIAQQAAVVLDNARHRRMATVDALTGCFAREHFFARLDEEYRRAVRYGGRFSLLMLDLDDFKRINDNHGHLAGDQFLRETGAVIRSQLRAADTAGRFGGDEFCLLLPETGLEGARVIAERIRAAIGAQRLVREGIDLRSTASIGLATFPRHDSGELHGLLRRADQALYRAKRAGRDRVVPFAA